MPRHSDGTRGPTDELELLRLARVLRAEGRRAVGLVPASRGLDLTALADRIGAVARALGPPSLVALDLSRELARGRHVDLAAALDGVVVVARTGRTREEELAERARDLGATAIGVLLVDGSGA